jgi:hypothetical protein
MARLEGELKLLDAGQHPDYLHESTERHKAHLVVLAENLLRAEEKVLNFHLVQFYLFFSEPAISPNWIVD